MIINIIFGGKNDMKAKEHKEFVFMRVFKAISSETRLKIMFLLFKHKKLNVNSIVKLTGKSEATICFHLKKMEIARFIRGEKFKKKTYYRIVKEKRLVLNYDILKLIEKWFKEKKGKEREREKKFIEDFIEYIMRQGSLSYFKRKILK